MAEPASTEEPPADSALASCAEVPEEPMAEASSGFIDEDLDDMIDFEMLKASLSTTLGNEDHYKC